MKKQILLIILLFCVSASGAEQARHEPLIKHPPSRSIKHSIAENACTSKESWTFTHRYGDTFPKEFARSLEDSTVLGGALLEISKLARAPRFSEPWAFGNYWIARLYFKNKLYALAQKAFSDFLKVQSATPRTLQQGMGVQVAAMECLTQIAQQVPTLDIPQYLPLVKFRNDLKDLPPLQIAIVQDLAVWVMKADLDHYIQGKNAEPLLSLFKPKGSHDSLVRGLFAARRGEQKQAIEYLERFLGFEKYSSLQLEKYRSTTHLLLGQMLYTQKQFNKSVAHFRKLEKNSNFMMEALSDLSWAYQLLANHSGALGTGYSLQAASLKYAFAPESQIVMAISFYELCRYPQAYGALQTFRQNYQTSYQWLKTWNQAIEKGPSIGAIPLSSPYRLAIDYLKNQKSMPEKVGAELIRSPLFLAAQTEINSLIEARKNIPKLRIAGFPFWYKPLDAFAKTIDERDQELVDAINSELRDRMLGMLRELDEIGINAEILEAETLRKAGDDVIWQNLNPDFQEFAAAMKGRIARQTGKFWDFGERPTTFLARGELWEDELGSFLASNSDLCAPRKSYRTAEVKTQN